MVVFCCSVCCDSLKKNQVQKHYSKCRMGMVSCMDCSQEFWNDDYQQHIKCISEEEKYSGKDYKPRPGQNKGEAKQDAWLQQVQKAIDSSNPSPKLRNLLERMKDYPNIPRKQAKFLNFLRNSLRVLDQKLANSLWEILMPAATQPKEEPKANEMEENNNDADNNGMVIEEQPEKNGAREEEAMEVDSKTKKINKREKKEERRKGQTKQEKKDNNKKHDDEEEEESERPAKKKGKKRKRNDDYSEDEEMERNEQEEAKKKKKKKSQKIQQKDEDDDGMPPLEPNLNHACLEETQEEEENSPPKNKKFNWEQTIYALLKNTKENSMSEKKLRKKVLAEYMDQDGHVDSIQILKAKFDRKIKKNQQFVRQKDKVCLRDE